MHRRKSRSVSISTFKEFFRGKTPKNFLKSQIFRLRLFMKGYVTKLKKKDYNNILIKSGCIIVKEKNVRGLRIFSETWIPSTFYITALPVTHKSFVRLL